MTVLGIDTATGSGSVALARGGTVLGAVPLRERGAHARDLLAQIDRLVRDAGLQPPELLAIAVTLGPGSFTGVRVGLSTAKGLAYALDVPLLGLSTLETLARAAAEDAAAPQAVCAAIEAGRGEIYAALFAIETSGPVRLSEDRSYRPAELLDSLPAGARIIGDGWAALDGAARRAGRPIAAGLPAPLLGGILARWGCGRVAAGERYRPGGARPNYVRPSDAEAKSRDREKS